MSPFLGEIVGTFILIFLGAGVCAGVSLRKSFAYSSGWIVITIAWGLAVTMAIFAVGKISGAHLNPAVTIALAIHGVFPWEQVLQYILAQMLGAFLGAFCIFIHYYKHWKITDDPSAKLGVFATGPAIPNPFFNLLSEMVGTTFLIVGILFIGANKFTEGLNPVVVGLLIVVISMSLGGTTGAAHNPARDLAPRFAHYILPIHGKGPSNWRYSWIPIVGPLLGGGLGTIIYEFLYEGIITLYFWGVIISSFVVLWVVYYYSRSIEQKQSFSKKAAS